MDIQEEITKNLCIDMIHKKENILKNTFLGIGIDVVDLMNTGRVSRRDDKMEETIFLDGEPILKFYPPEFESVNEGEKVVFKATQKYKVYKPKEEN